MKISLAISLLMAGASTAEDHHQFRQWTGANGVKVIAKLKRINKEAIKLESSSKGTVDIPLKELSNEDKIYIRSITRNPNIKFEHPSINSDQRKLIPSLNQVVFGNTNSNCGPNAVANFLIWWDQEGILPLPYKHSKLEDLADKLHSDLESVMRSKNGTSLDNLEEGIKKFFIKKGLVAKYLTLLKSHDASQENLASLPKNEAMAILSLQTLKNGKLDEGHYVSLVSLEKDIISFNTWGQRFVGKIRPGSLKDKKGIFIDLIKEPGSTHYYWLTEQGGGFFIDTKVDKITVMTVSKREKPIRVPTGIKKSR